MISISTQNLVEFARREVPGRSVAFAASYRRGSAWGLSLVVKDEAGHHRVPDPFASGTDQEMHRLADVLNDQLGLTRAQADAYVASTMTGALR